MHAEKTSAPARQPVDVWCLDIPVFKAVAVGALLVGSNEQDVGT
jgi:hypothetical protein